jgi:ATP-dependent Clp protease ATP-binding subunit ClpC
LQKYIEDPLSEALIQGNLPRPADLEVYLGDTGIYYRQVNVPEPEAVTANGETEAAPALPAPGVQLYTF